MKTLIIILQMLALVFAAWFTRPSDHDFRNYVHRQLPLKADSLLSQSATDAVATEYLARCTFRDRGLWVEVTREGQVVWIGALAHWFDRALIQRNEPGSDKPG